MRALTAIVLSAFAVALCGAALPVTTPPPTWAPPQFDGYIALAQYRCMDFLCKEWSLGVSRLATECFTWGCKYEQTHLNTLVGTSPLSDMSFTVLTALHHPTRNFYTIGIVAPERGLSRLWVSSIAADVNSSNVKKSYDVYFPWPQWQNPLVSMEAHPTTGEPIAIFLDGSVGTISLTNGSFTKHTTVLSTNTTRQLTQTTTIDQANGMLFILAIAQPGTTENDGWPSIITVDLSSWAKAADVNTPNMSKTLAYPPLYFAMSWIPQVNHLVVFATGNWDSLIYMNPKTGNTSLAIWDLSNVGNFVAYFSDNSNTKTWDTYKNNAYDEKSGMLYFQAHVETEGEGIDSLMSVGPFVAGEPQTFYWTNEALSPVNFGYQGMHFIHCEGKCPT